MVLHSIEENCDVYRFRVVDEGTATVMAGFVAVEEVEGNREGSECKSCSVSLGYVVTNVLPRQYGFPAVYHTIVLCIRSVLVKAARHPQH